MKRPGAIFLLGAVAIGGVAAMFACINEHARPVTDAGPITGAIVCDGGGPGNFPPANCDPSDNTCPTTPVCNLDKTTCGDPATCLPLADNTNKKVLDFRLRRLLITAPAPLVGTGVGFGVLQTTVIDKGINLDWAACGDLGTGAFSWIMRVDETASTMTTGGAPPSPDPVKTGFCFYNFNVGGIPVAPVQVPITFDDAGAFSTSPITLLNVPIFLAADAGASNAANVVVLPLRHAAIQNATVSAGGNCIGSFNEAALDKTCTTVSDPSSCSKWHTAGSLGGAMTLEDADKVPLTILPETLCVLLTNSKSTDGGSGCARDAQGNIIAKGDYCSATNKPGDCQDSFWLSATFAAAAVTINDGSGDPTCQATTDGGTDGGSDAAGDAPID